MNGIPTSFAAPKDCDHNWEVVSMVFETQMLDGSGRVVVRQPDIEEAHTYFICRGCASHTFMTTQWFGARMYGSQDAIPLEDRGKDRSSYGRPAWELPADKPEDGDDGD